LYALHHVVKCAVKEICGGVGMSKELIEKIRTKKAHTKVLGLWHVGLSTATIARAFLQMQVIWLGARLNYVFLFFHNKDL